MYASPVLSFLFGAVLLGDLQPYFEGKDVAPLGFQVAGTLVVTVGLILTNQGVRKSDQKVEKKVDEKDETETAEELSKRRRDNSSSADVLNESQVFDNTSKCTSTTMVVAKGNSDKVFPANE